MSQFGFASTAEEVTEGIDLTGTTWLITGANSGLGRESARVLGKRGAYIIALARTAEKARLALDELGIEGTGVACELSNLDSVRSAVAELSGVTLDGILANAGIMALPELRQTAGIEQQLFVNHVGHFLLVTSLVDQLTDTGRVVVLSSGAHRMAKRGLELDNTSGETDYHDWRMYGRSKLANILFTRSLARKFAESGSQRTANCLHPGVIRTNLARHIEDRDAMFQQLENIMKTVEQGAATQCYVATSPDLAQTSGVYFNNCAPEEPIPAALDDQLADDLWAWTEQVVAAS